MTCLRPIFFTFVTLGEGDRREAVLELKRDPTLVISH